MKSYSYFKTILLQLFLCSSVILCGQQKIKLVINGKPNAEIIIGNKYSGINKFAAKELNTYIKKISGSEFPVISTETNTTKNIISIGQSKQFINAGLENIVNKLKSNGFIIKTLGQTIFIAGPDSLGTLFGVYEFLERLGVRWFMPGPLGEVVPQTKNISISSLDITEEPDYKYRWIGENNWSRRNKCNVNIPMGEKIIGIKIWKKFHSFSDLLNANKYFKDHPEYFSYYDGSRHKYNPRLGPKVGLDWNNQICTSNPEVIKQVATNLQKVLKKDPQIEVVTLGPNDGNGFCEGPNCKALDEKGDAPDQIMSRRLLIFYDQVAKIINKTNPGKLVKFGAYYIYTRPPKDTTIKALNNMMVMITHYNEYSLSHPINDKSSIPNGKFRSLLFSWRKIVKHMFMWEYYYKVNWLELPWPIVHSIREDIPYLRKIGVEGFYTQYSNNNDFTLLLNDYVAAKLLWNVHLNVDSLLNDFYTKFYGNASVPMKKYYSTMETSMSNAGDIAGYAPDNAYKVFTDSVLNICSDALHNASTLARKKLVKKRVEMAVLSLEYTKKCVNFLKMAKAASNKGECEKALNTGEDLVKYIKANKTKYKGILDMSPLIGKDSPWYLGAVITSIKDKIKNIDNRLPKR